MVNLSGKNQINECLQRLMSDDEMTFEDHLENIDNTLLALNRNLNQNIEQMNMHLKYISYAALIWIILTIVGILAAVIMLGSLNETVVEAS